MFKPLREYWRIPSLQVHPPVQSYVDAARVEHGWVVLKLEQPGRASSVHFNVDDLADGVNCTILFNIEIKTAFQRSAWELEHFGQHVVSEVVIVLFDKLLVLLVWLQTPQMQLLRREVF